MIKTTFKEFLVEGYQRRKKVDATGVRSFCYEVQDAIWKELKKLNIHKDELLIEVSVNDHWDNHLIDKFEARGLHSLFKKNIPNDRVKVRFAVNKGHRKATHDAQLLFQILPKFLEKVLAQFFGRTEPFADNSVNDEMNGSSQIFLGWRVWDPKWLE